MKTIGLIGGLSWESTVPYYRLINRAVADRLGGFHSAPLLLLSVDFAPLERHQRAGRWGAIGRSLAAAARRLEGTGAELLVLCSNTMHKVAPAIERAISIPLVHIAEATADAVEGAAIGRVGLLGTRFTMNEPFYRERLERRGIEVLVPGARDRAAVDRVIFEELCHGRLLARSRALFGRVIQRLAARGAMGAILGCTEISLLIGPADAELPLFDTTEIHALAAVEAAMGVHPPDRSSVVGRRSG